MKDIKIKITDWTHTCSDGCCTTYGTNVNIDGVDLECQNQDVSTILRNVLEHLGYKVDIETIYE
jgi:hypothetical protein